MFTSLLVSTILSTEELQISQLDGTGSNAGSRCALRYGAEAKCILHNKLLRFLFPREVLRVTRHQDESLNMRIVGQYHGHITDSQNSAGTHNAWL